MAPKKSPKSSGAMSRMMDAVKANPYWAGGITFVIVVGIIMLIVWAVGGFDSEDDPEPTASDDDSSVIPDTSTSVVTPADPFRSTVTEGGDQYFGKYSAISPDGTLIAVTNAEEDLTCHIFPINKDRTLGTPVEAVRTNQLGAGAQMLRPSFSPSGEFLLIANTLGSTARFYVMNAVTGAEVFQSSQMAWSVLAFGWMDSTSYTDKSVAAAHRIGMVDLTNNLIKMFETSDKITWTPLSGVGKTQAVHASTVGVAFLPHGVITVENGTMIEYVLDGSKDFSSVNTPVPPPSGINAANFGRGSAFAVCGAGIHMAIGRTNENGVDVYKRTDLNSDFTKVAFIDGESGWGIVGSIVQFQGHDLIISSTDMGVNKRRYSRYKVNDTDVTLIKHVLLSDNVNHRGNNISTSDKVDVVGASEFSDNALVKGNIRIFGDEVA